MTLRRCFAALLLAATACGAADDDDLDTTQAALARSASCAASPNPAAAGAQFTVTASGLQGKRMFNVDIFAAGSSTAEVAYYAWTDSRGNLVSWSGAAEVQGVLAELDRPGSYTIRILELGRRLSDPGTWVAACPLQLD